MGGSYEAWLDLSVDHVVPQHLIKAGWPPDWVLDLINLVTCCRACNEFLNGYRVPSLQAPLSVDAFASVRDQVFGEKLQHAQTRHSVERERFAAARPAGPVEVQEDLANVRGVGEAATNPRPALAPVKRTQRVTANDIARGQVRVPHETKGLFPSEKDAISVDFLGHSLECRWDPRYGPDQERSGVLKIGRSLMGQLAKVDEVLAVVGTANGVRLLRPS
jgi:hypothetical protein